MNHSRGAMALLIVLLAVTAISAAAVSGLVSLRSSSQAAATGRDDRLFADLLLAGEHLTSEWLRTRSATVILGPAGGGIPIVRDRLGLGGLTAEVQVDCYDGLAMTPAMGIRPQGPLRAGMVLTAPVPEAVPIGAVVSSGWLESVVLPTGVRRFPLPLAASAASWGSANGSVPSRRDGLATSLATTVFPQGDGRINLQTVPVPVLRDIAQQLHLGDIDLVVQQRMAGKPCTLPAVPTDRGSLPFTLVTTSDRWAALITVTLGERRRSWWVVFAVVADKVRIVQRHDADR